MPTVARSYHEAAQHLVKRIAELAATGRSNIYIAHHLRIGFNTVKKHVSQALAKLGASNRTELAFLLSRVSDSEEATPRFDNDLMGGLIVEAAREAYETAQYLLKRGHPSSGTHLKEPHRP